MPVLQPDDYAVVVGISKYPGYGPNRDPADLKAPDADATLVYDWLVSETGGGLRPPAKGMPDENEAPDEERRVWLIRSSDYSPPAQHYLNAKPQYEAVKRAFREIHEFAVRNSRRPGTLVGRRLYIYMTGHGISPDIDHGCLVAADATQTELSNINVSGWFDWFQRTRYFDEYILWLDCCMDQKSPSVKGEAGLGGPDRAGPPLKRFRAFAANRTLKAVEAPIRVEGRQDPEIHGCFTWALLRGLHGGAVDEKKRQVTGGILKGYIKNNMKLFMTDIQLANDKNDQECDIETHDGLAFGPVWPELPEFKIRLTFEPEAASQAYVVLGGSPPRPVATGTTAAKVELRLAPGVYVVAVAAAGLRQGFVAADEGQSPVAVAKAGVAPRSPAEEEEFTLTVTTANPATEIAVVDRRLVLHGQPAVGSLSRRLRYGIYKIRARLGAELVERVVLLDSDTELDMSVALASPVPIQGSKLSHEDHQAALQSLRQGARGRGAGPASATAAAAATAEVLVLGRYWTRAGDAAADPPAAFLHPLVGVTLRRPSGRKVADLSRTKVQNGGGRDPVAGLCLPVAPGAYLLRHGLAGGRVYEQTLVASPGWRTEVYLRPSLPAPGTPATPERRDIGETAVLMKPAGSAPPEDWTPDPEAELVEAARLALGTGRDILSGAPEVEELLLRRFTDPVAGILGAHVLLRTVEEAQRKQPDAPGTKRRLELLAGAVLRLRELVGTSHPDVEALALACPEVSPRPEAPFAAPPMLHRSWRLLVRAAKERPGLVPRSLWDKVHATSGVRPFLVWAADRPTREAHLKALKARLTPGTRSEDRGPPPPRSRSQPRSFGGANVAFREMAPAWGAGAGGFGHLAGAAPPPPADAAIPDELAAQFDLPPSAVAALGG